MAVLTIVGIVTSLFRKEKTMAENQNGKLQAVSIGKLGEYDTLLKAWASSHASGITETRALELIAGNSINAVVSATEPANQNENDIWLQEYN